MSSVEPPLPSSNVPAPVEKKVTAATVAAFLLGVLVAILNGVQDNPDLLGVLPTWLQGLLLVLIPTVVTFVAGYSAKHTHRPDLNRNSGAL